jgi:glycosyltransferase involved in cell wall biosynthesis
MRPALKQLCQDLDISNQVIFSGSQPNARKLLQALDLLILPSRSEGLPLALLEAMAESVPVMTTDSGECRNVLQNGKFGTILPDNEDQWPPIIDQTIAEIQSGRFAEKVSKAARNIAENYSIDKTTAAYEEIYQRIYKIR